MKNIGYKITQNTRSIYNYAAILLLLFITSLFVKKGECVLFINGHHNAMFDQILPVVTNLGDGLVFLPIVLVLSFVRFQYAIMGISITVLSGVISSIFKRIIFPGLARPKNFIDNDLLYFVPGVDVHGANSFPSGHTMTAFCAALFITLITRNKNIGIASLLLALLVGYSRIYMLQHFLVDVAAGAVIGCFATLMVWQTFKNINRPEWMEKRINVNFKPKARSRA